VTFSPSLAQNFIQRENLLSPIKLNTGNFCDMEIPPRMCASERVFGIFEFLCNFLFLCRASFLNTKISVLSTTFVINFSSVILRLQLFGVAFSPLPQLFHYNKHLV